MTVAPVWFKRLGYFVVTVYLLSMIVSAIFDKPVVVSLGFLIVAATSPFGIWYMYRNSIPYPGIMGKMESWYGREYVTVFFIFAAFLLLLAAISMVYRDLRGIVP